MKNTTPLQTLLALTLLAMTLLTSSLTPTDVRADVRPKVRTENISQTFSNAFSGELHLRLLTEARRLGAPMKAVHRALNEARSETYTNRNVIGLFDLSQTSNKKRFYLLDLQHGTVSAYHCAHGRGNGGNLRATRFRGFQAGNSDMTPLGALRTAGDVERHEHYEVVQDRYNSTTYRDLVILDLEGVKSYNQRFNRHDLWVILHANWYVTGGYRRSFSGLLGRSKGCLVLDPKYSNQVFHRLAGGALIYITVGDHPIENYL